jgi:hypothetical protein
MAYSLLGTKMTNLSVAGQQIESMSKEKRLEYLRLNNYLEEGRGLDWEAASDLHSKAAFSSSFPSLNSIK